MAPLTADALFKFRDGLIIPDQLQHQSPLIAGFWVLDIAKAKGNPKLTAEEISSVLVQIAEIQVEPIAIARAFARARGKIKYEKPAKVYELMKPGRDDLQKALMEISHLPLLFLTGQNAWTDSSHSFPRVVDRLQGDFRIVDRYYGPGSIFVLSKFGKTRRIKFLTAELGRNEQNLGFQVELQKFKSEFRNIEMKQFGKPWELHDRYILADNGLVLVGQGLKDLGQKESFVVFIDKSVSGGILPVLIKAFDERWKKSNNL